MLNICGQTPIILYIISFITFAKHPQERENTLFLVWNAAYFYEEYIDNIIILVFNCQEILSAYVNTVTHIPML